MSAQPLGVGLPPSASKKEEKPTLAGVNVKTRKRNVAVPHDPAGFAEGVLKILKAKSDIDDTSERLSAAVKALDASNLDFSRYGVELFEIFFAGARMGIGTKLADDTKEKIDWNILACEAEIGDIKPYIMAFKDLVRRRPFLVQRLEEVLKKLLTSLEFFDDDGRRKIAIVTALVFSEKLGVLPDRIFESMFNDRLVAKGTILAVVTDIFKNYIALSNGNVDELCVLLSKAKVSDRLLEYFPPGQQTEEAFKTHFEKEGMTKLVEWQSKKLRDNNTVLLQANLSQLFSEEAGTEAYIDCVREYSSTVPGEEIIKVIWSSMVGSINTVGKNQMQMLQMIVKLMKQNKALLEAYTKSFKLELALLNCLQVTCYEDSKLLKIFVDLVKQLYNLDIIAEDTINYWYKKGSVPRGRNVFLNDIQPFIKWLEEAEEDDDDDDEE